MLPWFCSGGVAFPVRRVSYRYNIETITILASADQFVFAETFTREINFKYNQLHPSSVRVIRRSRKYWSRCYHPTTLTLNMTASQRVEGMFGVLKKGRYIHRRATLVWVKEELERRVKQFAITSRM